MTAPTAAPLPLIAERLLALVAAQTFVVKQHMAGDASIEDIGQCVKQHALALDAVAREAAAALAQLPPADIPLAVHAAAAFADPRSKP